MAVGQPDDVHEALRGHVLCRQTTEGMSFLARVFGGRRESAAALYERGVAALDSLPTALPC